MPDDSQTTVPVEPAAQVPITTPIANPVTDSSTQPLVLSESDIKVDKPAVKEEVSEPIIQTEKEGQLESKVEVLTGEVEALSNKIENLVNNVKPTTDSPIVTVQTQAKVAEPAMAKEEAASETSVSPLSQKAEVAPIVSEDTSKKEVTSEVPATAPATPMPAVPKPDLPLNDIYPSAQMPSAPKSNDPYKPTPVGEFTQEHHDSILGTIGEVVGSIGLTVLLVMVLSPLYKGIFPVSIWDAIKLIGWLTAVGSLFVGFFFSLFSPRKITLKALLLVGLLISTLLFLGVDGSDSIIAKLDVYLGQYLVYFR